MHASMEAIGTIMKATEELGAMTGRLLNYPTSGIRWGYELFSNK